MPFFFGFFTSVYEAAFPVNVEQVPLTATRVALRALYIGLPGGFSRYR